MIRQRFQEYSYKSCIVILTWRVKLNYGYSPFKETVDINHQCTIHNGTLKSMNYILMFIIKKNDYFRLWCLQKWPAHFYCNKKPELSELNTFKLESSTLLIRYRFQGFHSESCVVIFAWKVTWNYAYSPFKEIAKTTIISLSYCFHRIFVE